MMNLFDTDPSPGSPSAISAMMQSMQGQPTAGGLMGGPVPNVGPGQMPQFQPPPFARPKQPESLIGRIQSRLAGLLESARPDAPAGFEGLLSEQEIQRANPGIMARFAAMAPGEQTAGEKYRGNLESMLKMKQIAGGLQSQKAMQAAREKIAAQFPALPNETGEQAVERMKLMFAAYVQAGDMEAAGKLGEVIKSIGQPRAATGPKQYEPKEFQLRDGSIAWISPGEPIPAGAKPYRAPSTASGGVDRVLLPVQQPDGTVVYTPRSEAAGKIASGTKGSKATEGETAYGMFAARMASAEPLLDRYEPKGAPGYVVSGARKIPIFGDDIANTVSSGDQQLYRQAQEDWVRAKLRKESGAAIGDKEMESEIRLYFPQPGDEDAVKKQKRERRLEAQRLMQAAAGRGAAAFTPKGSGSATGSKLDAYRHLLK